MKHQGMAIWDGFWALFILALFATTCCGSTQSRVDSANDVLNHFTDLVDPAYEAERLDCNQKEETLVAMASAHVLSGAELQASVNENRARCDKAFMWFEELILLQATARMSLDSVQHGDEGALKVLEESLQRLKTLWGKKP